MIKCDWAMLCHDIEPHPESGGFSILGIFQKLLVDRLPGTLSPLNMAVRLSGMPGDGGEFSVVVRDQEGNVLKQLPTEHIILKSYGYVDFTAPLGPLSLKRTGLHVVVISIDGVELRRVPMPVEEVHVV
jgi:uncharacterized protein DUF6941